MISTAVRQRPIESGNYDRRYYCSHAGGLGGYRIIRESRGREFPGYLETFWKECGAQEGMTILDIGCGRGEFAVFAAAKGANVFGVDYSAEAVGIAEELALLCSDEIARRSSGKGRVKFLLSNARELPFSSAMFDRITSRAVLEHLHQWELSEMLAEIRRVVKENGIAILCTNPNLWYKKYGLHLVRAARRFVPALDGISAAGAEEEEEDDFHVNEQSFFGLSRALGKAGFAAKISIEPRFHLRPEVLKERVGGWWAILHWTLFLLERVPPSSWFFGENILCKARPVSEAK